MSEKISRRVFLKGAAVAALAVSVTGLTGCGGVSSPTAVVLGEYKVDVDLKDSLIGINGDKGAVIQLPFKITNQEAGPVATPFVRNVFPSVKAGDTELALSNGKNEVITLPMKVPTECDLSFRIEDMALYQKISSGAVELTVTVKLSGETAVYTLNLGTLTATVAKN